MTEKYNNGSLNEYSIEPRIMDIGEYHIEVRLPLESKYGDLEKERLQVNISTKDGEEFYADFITTDYIKGVMKEKNFELGLGNYFLGRDKIILKDLKQETVKNTLEDLLLNWDHRLEYYFKKQ